MSQSSVDGFEFDRGVLAHGLAQYRQRLGPAGADRPADMGV
jgi:hypothetical protein